MPRLVIEKGVDKGKEVLVTPALSVSVGREVAIAPGNIRLTDTMVSRSQFRIVHRDGTYYLIDEESRNGTFVNGQRVKEQLLEIGARIDAGETMMSFLADTEEPKRGGRVGQMIGGYRLVERVGRGGMGTVYKALQLSLNRVVALKLLAEELVRDQSFINLFIQEARAAAALNHPNIVQVYDVNRVADRDAYVYYFSMEFLPNGSVQDHLGKEKKLTPKKATRIVLDAARGLEYAEKKKIVHRDIKPDNLMIGEDGIVKIGDLGLAKKLDPAINVKDDREQGCVFGTPHYVAPEQALGRPADHRSDIYSLGSTFYRLVAGQTPYQGTSAREIVIAKVKTEPVPLVEMDPTLPANLVTIVDRMMKKEPAERYQSASEVVQALEAIRVELEGGPTTMTTMPQATAVMEAPPLAQRVLVPIFMVLVMGALGAAGYFGYRYFEKPPDAAGGGNGNGVTPTPPVPPPDDPSKEKLAAKVFSDAEAFERTQMNPNLAPSVKEAIQKFEEVRNLARGTKYARLAEEAIGRLRKTLTSLGASEALKGVQTLKRQMEDLLASKKPRREVQDGVKNLRDEMERQVKALTKGYEGTDAEGTARKALEDAGKAQKAFLATGETYDKAVKNAVELKGAHKYGAAVKALEDFRWSLPKDSWFERQAGDDLALLRTEAETAWTGSVEKPVMEKTGSGDYAGARDVIARESDLFDIPQYRDRAKALSEQVDSAERQRKETAYREQREKDLALYEAAYVRSLPRLPQQAEYRFDLGRAEVLAVRKAIATDEVGRMLDERAEVLGAMATLKAALIDRINGKGGLAMKKGTAFLQRYQQTVTLVSADDAGVMVDLPNPKSRIKADWSSWTPRKLRGIVLAGWDLSPAERYALGLLGVESSVIVDASSRETEMWNEAREDFEAARSAADGGKDPRVFAMATETLGRLDDLRGAAREKCADLCVRVGALAMREERWADAVAAYSWIAERMDDTQAWRNHRDEVRENLPKAKANSK